MNRSDKDKIKEHLPTLVEDIDPLHIMTYLPCLLKYHKESIANTQHSVLGNRSLAVHKLLDILYTQPTGFQEFVKALRNPEVDKHDIADKLDYPPDTFSNSLAVTRSETVEMSMSVQRNTTATQSRKSPEKPVTMETPYKDLPYSVANKLRVMDSGQIKNADKLAEVIDLTLQEVNDIKARCKSGDSLSIAYLQYWDEKEGKTLLELFQALHKMERIDLIQELEKSVNIRFQHERENDCNEHEDRVNTETVPNTSQHNVQPCNVGPMQHQPYKSHRNVQPSNVGSAQHQPNVGEVFIPANNRTAVSPDVAQQRLMSSSRPDVFIKSIGQPAPVHRNANGSLNTSRPTVHMQDAQPSKITMETGAYSDNQAGIGSFESDSNKKPSTTERPSKFNGYSPEELLNSNQSHLNIEEEKDESLKDKPRKVFIGYKKEEILQQGGAYGNETGATLPQQTIVNNLSECHQPDSQVPTNPRPEFGQQIGDCVRNIAAPQNDINDLDHCSSNSENSQYGSMPDNNQDFGVTGDHKVENVGSVCEGAQSGQKLMTMSNDKDNIAPDKTCNAMSSMEEMQNVTDSSVRLDSDKCSGLSENVRIGSTEQQRRLLEHDLLHSNINNIMGLGDSDSREMSIADSSTGYSYVSQIEDIERPKLSIESELNSIKRKAKKCLPGDDCGESDLLCYNNDLNEEQLSVDGISPGIVDGISPGIVDGISPGIVDGISPGIVDGISPGIVDGQMGMLGDAGMFTRPEPFTRPQGTSPGAQGISPAAHGTCPAAQGISPAAQGTPQYIIQQPPNLDVLCHENVRVVNNNFLIVNEHSNQGVTQLESSVRTHQVEQYNQQERSQYGQYSVHEPPRLVELGATSEHNTVHEGNGAIEVARQQTDTITPMSEELQSDKRENSADYGRWGDVLTSSIRLAFNVFKTTYDYTS